MQQASLSAVISTSFPMHLLVRKSKKFLHLSSASEDEQPNFDVGCM